MFDDPAAKEADQQKGEKPSSQKPAVRERRATSLARMLMAGRAASGVRTIVMART